MTVADPDFIEVYEHALAPHYCAQLIAQFEASGQAQPGRVGGGVMPDLKDSRDIQISGNPEWQQAEAALQTMAFRGVMAYLRRYPYALIAPLMLQTQDPASGQVRRIVAEDFPGMDDAALGNLIRAVFRPGSINIQRYTAGQGGYPYWHCELYPRDPGCDSLHRHLLWTVYLNDNFEAGETEFRYQSRKITPKTGSLLIAPAAFTHTHRGNRPERGDKYIATSWTLFQRAEQIFGNP